MNTTLSSVKEALISEMWRIEAARIRSLRSGECVAEMDAALTALGKCVRSIDAAMRVTFVDVDL